MKMSVLCNIAQPGLVQVARRFRHAYTHLSGNGGSKYLWNVDKFIPDYSAQHPKRQSLSYSPE
jgi:hypothetical protein